MPEQDRATGIAVPVLEPTNARRLVRVGLAVTLLIALYGLWARVQMIAWGLVFPGPVNVFFRLYAFHEPLPLLLLAGWTLVAAAVMARRAPMSSGATWLERLGAPSTRAVRVMAGLMFLVSLATWYLVHHAVLLTMDEFTSDFQARILARGELRATVPTEWQP